MIINTQKENNFSLVSIAKAIGGLHTHSSEAIYPGGYIRPCSIEALLCWYILYISPWGWDKNLPILLYLVVTKILIVTYAFYRGLTWFKRKGQQNRGLKMCRNPVCMCSAVFLRPCIGVWTCGTVSTLDYECKDGQSLLSVRCPNPNFSKLGGGFEILQFWN